MRGVPERPPTGFVEAPTRFCSTCGGEKVNGSCATCNPRTVPLPRVSAGTQVTAQPSLSMPSPVRRRLWVPVLACAVGISLAMSALVVALDVRTDAAHMTARVRSVQERETQALRQEAQALRRQVVSMTVSESVLNRRLAKLESKVNGRPDPAVIARKSAPSVFTVGTDAGTGSGFIASADGNSSELVTNYHVIAKTYARGGRSVRITRGKLTYTGRITRVSQVEDLALVTLPRKLAVLPIATKRSAVGAPVLVLGSPLGLDGTVTSGIVSAYRTERGSRYLQFSAPISPGNSGGPVLNERGEVVGVSVSKYVGDGAEGLSFAIPAEKLCPAIHIC